MFPGLLPIFLHGCKIKSGSVLGMRLGVKVPGSPVRLSSADYLFHVIDHNGEISRFSGNQQSVDRGTNKLQLFIQ